jgi:enoyl-CoA hydratase
MSEFEYLTYETVDDGVIARITLNRPEVRNAQNRGMLLELNDAFLRAEADDQVRVAILQGAGPVFSAGHDLGSEVGLRERTPGPDQHPSYSVNGGSRRTPGQGNYPNPEQNFLQEWHHFFQNTRRWRDLRKITIAAVRGPVVAGALMLAWCCDLIVASDDTVFADVVGTRLGVCGAEYFAHPWEFGPRKAKELLLTGDCIDADEAYRLGMVSKVFTGEELERNSLEFARRIAKLPTMTALLIKESVNQSVDQMGFSNALASCFSLHELSHAHWANVTADRRLVATPEFGVPAWKEAPPVVPAEKGSVRADAADARAR